jgi:hypothetical protein
MQTRQTSKNGNGGGGVNQYPNVGNGAGSWVPIDMQTQTQLMSTTSAPLPDLGTHEGMLEQTQADWIQQMHNCERLGWRGGDEFYDGQHIRPELTIC